MGDWRIRVAACAAGAMAVVSAERGLADTASYSPPQAFMDLYDAFVSSGGPSAIGTELAEADAGGATKGPLILVTGTGIYAYAPDRTLIAHADTRLNPASGFFELTAVSHVGPAIAYLARLNELGDGRWQDSLDGLLADVKAVRRVNAETTDNWLDRLDLAAWAPHRDQIGAMVDYAMWMAGTYLQDVKDGDASAFTVDAVDRDFLSVTSHRFPIPYNAVMIGTFSLVTLSSLYGIHADLADTGIDWAAARVVIRMKVGTNVTAGLTAGTQPKVELLRLLSGGALPAESILIAPFADQRPSIGQPELPQEDFDYYAVDVWSRITSRNRIGGTSFVGVDDIYLPARPPLPGDYGVTPAGDIDAFIMRLKHSLTDPRELLSNTVGFWMGPAFAAAGWDPAKVEIPGLTAGLPGGVDGYPADSPPF